MNYFKDRSSLLIICIGIGATFTIMSCEEQVEYPTPEADFTFEVTDLSVKFSTQTKNVTKYSWDFGDGSTSDQKHPVHTYQEYGQYTVHLLASGAGGSEIAKDTIDLKAPLEVSFNAEINDYTVSFTANDDSFESYNWDFGDGNSSSEINPTHTYQGANNYTVALSVSKDEQSASTEKQITIVAPEPTISLSATIDPNDVMTVILTVDALFVDTYDWDYGDGNTSTRQGSHSYTYQQPGEYTISVTVEGPGGSGSDLVELAINLTPYTFLTGGPTAANGKKWKMAAAHSPQDRIANADPDFTVVDITPHHLPYRTFELEFGMGEVYQDEFTFSFDGSYSMDLKHDSASLSGLLYQLVTTGGADIVNDGGRLFNLCTAHYTPESGATFTYVENEDLTVSSVYGPGGQLTYENVSTLDFSGTMFVGFRDFQQKVILDYISDTSMRLIMFMAADQNQANIGVNTHALILTFEVVN